ncbi:MAG: TonB-dependent receptor [Bacteroidota bacterium]
MKQFLYTLLTAFLFVNAQAQSIKGNIKTLNGNSIEAASISILNTDKTTIADKQGDFVFKNIAPGTYQLSISSIGFATQLKEVKVAANQSTEISITLTEQNQQLGEVIVSSEKREEKLQKTPIAVSVLNTQQLKDYRIWDVRDLEAVVPDLFVIEHAGSTGANFVNIRGVMGFTPEQSVATYIDGVYQFDYWSAPSPYYNIERIEILRGPQGTLYGRNSLAGVINVITKKPTDTTTGQVELNFGNYGQQRYSAAISTPIIKSKLFLGADFMYTQRGSVFTNQGKPYDKQYGDAFNLSLKYLANSRLSFDFNVKGKFSKDYGAYPWQTISNIDSLIKSPNPYDVSYSNPNIEQLTNINTSLAVHYAAKHFNFISISAYNNFHQGYPGSLDGDYTAADIFSYDVTYQHGQHNFSEEVRISSKENGSRFKWLGGIYAFSQKYNKVTTFNNDTDAVSLGYVPDTYSTVTYSPVHNTGISFFGQLGYNFSSQWNITAGGRIDNEKRTLSQYVDSVKNNTSTLISPTIDYSHTYTKFTPKITLSYQATETQMLYASYAKGYRVGGFNAGQTPDKVYYSPENSDNFELGYKSTFLNNKVRFNAALFYLYEKDNQVLDAINGYYTNLGNFRNMGIETELTALLAKGFLAQWNFSYTDSKFTKLQLPDLSTGATKDYSGNKIIFNPPVTSMLALQYNYQLQNNKAGIAVFARGEWRYVGKYYFDYYNEDSQDGYSLFNARAGITAKRFEVAFWARNLADKRYVTYGNQSPTFPVYMISNPRMWGVTLTYKF